MNNPFSGQSAVFSQPNLPLMSQWTPAVTQCITGVTSDGNTNPSVGVFSSVTPISQQQFPHVSSGGTVYYGFPNHDTLAENTYIYQQQPFAADPSNTLPSLQPAPQPQAVTLNDLVQALSQRRIPFQNGSWPSTMATRSNGTNKLANFAVL